MLALSSTGLASKGVSPVLCIGDQGQWPGNDFGLLAGPYARADGVSLDPRLAGTWPRRATVASERRSESSSLRQSETGLRFVSPREPGG